MDQEQGKDIKANKVLKNKKQKSESEKKATKRKRTSKTEEVEHSDSDKLSCDEDSDDSLQQTNKDEHSESTKRAIDYNWKWEKLTHTIFPQLNSTCSTNIDDLRGFPLLGTATPHLVYACSKKINEQDVCHRRTINLTTYKRRLKALQTAYFNATKNKRTRKNEKNGVYCSAFFRFAEMLQFDPDPYFVSNYDFYYTTGNLCVKPDTNEVLHASGTNMECLHLSEFAVKNGAPEVRPIASVYLADEKHNESEIFEIQFSQAENDFFFVRQKFCVSMTQYNRAEDTFYVHKKFKSKKLPIISFAQDAVETRHLAISNLAYEVSFHDLERDVAIQKLCLAPEGKEKTASKWNTIKSWDRSVYLYATHKRLTIIDTRLPEIEWRSKYCTHAAENVCFKFCSLAMSGFDNLFYAGSTHKSYCLDMRYMGTDIDSKNTAVVRWTHQMDLCPLMMATCRHDDCEYVTLQSPLHSDLRICENIQCKETTLDTSGNPEKKARVEMPSYKSPCMPYMPPPLDALFHEARQQGKCLNPSSGLTERIQACITGLSFAGNKSNPYILTATSNGDLFARHMYTADCESKSDAASAEQMMTQYEELFNRSVQKPILNVTQVCDLSGISKAFRCQMLSETKLDSSFKPDAKKRMFMGRWQKSLRALTKYKDALVPDLLSIWDIDDELEKDNINITALSRTVPDSESLVAGWLDKSQNIAHSTMLNMTSIPENVLNASDAFDYKNESSLFLSNVSQIEPECAASQMILAKPKVVKKKKSRYVQGF